jgi:hypothetical protein
LGGKEGRLKVRPARPWRLRRCLVCSRGVSFRNARDRCPAVDFSADADLISFLNAIPDGRYRRGVRYPQLYLLLITVLGISSECRSSRDLEAFAKRHREALNQALGLIFKRWPTDATFLYLFNKAHLEQSGEVLQA